MNQGNKDFGCKKVGSRFSCVTTRTKRFSLALPRAAKKNVSFSSSFGGPEAPLFFYIYIYNFLSNLAHLNHKPDITMVYSLHGCVQIFTFIFIYLFFLAGGGGGGGGGVGVCQIGRYLQYIYFLFFALDIIVCIIFMFTLFHSFFPAIAGQYFRYLENHF